MRNQRLASVVVLATTAAAFLAACGGGEDTSSRRSSLTFAIGATEASLMQPWIAQEEGYFKDEGLDVKIRIDGSNVLTSVVSGQADIGTQGISASLSGVQKGADLKTIYWQLGNKAGGFLVGRTGVASPAQCKTVATQPEGTSVYGWAELYSEELHLTFDHKTFQDPSVIPASLASGQVDCAVSTYGQVGPLVDAGKATVLIDPRKADDLPASIKDVNFIDTGMYAKAATLKSKKDPVIKFLAAIVRAQRLMDESTPDQLAQMLLKSSDWSGFKADALADLISATEFSWSPNEGQIDASVWPAQLEFAKRLGLTFIDPADSKWAYDDRVDMSYLDAASKAAQGS